MGIVYRLGEEESSIFFTQFVLFYCIFSVFHSLRFYHPMFVLFRFMGSISMSTLGVILGFYGCEFQRAFQWVFGYLIFLMSRGYSMGLSVFYRLVSFHQVWDFSIDLSCSIISLCCHELNFFCLYFLHGTITSCREILFVVLFIGSTTNVCLCFLIKIPLDYCNKETGVAILNFFIT